MRALSSGSDRASMRMRVRASVPACVQECVLGGVGVGARRVYASTQTVPDGLKRSSRRMESSALNTRCQTVMSVTLGGINACRTSDCEFQNKMNRKSGKLNSKSRKLHYNVKICRKSWAIEWLNIFGNRMDIKQILFLLPQTFYSRPTTQLHLLSYNKEARLFFYANYVVVTSGYLATLNKHPSGPTRTFSNI